MADLFSFQINRSSNPSNKNKCKNMPPSNVEILTAMMGNLLVLKFSNLSFQFDLANVTQFAAHQDNKRLIGLVVCAADCPGEDSMSAYVFESNTEGEKVWK